MTDLLQVQRDYNPIGTKILIEVEIMEDAGHNKLTAAVCVKEVMEKVQELLGVQFNKIYLQVERKMKSVEIHQNVKFCEHQYYHNLLEVSDT